MSEIADELERMAKQIDGDVEVKRREADAEPDRECWRALDGEADGMEHAAKLLRTRAAELRQQRSEPTYKPQPKPAEAKAGQWWSFRDVEPERVTVTLPFPHESGMRVFFNDVDWEYSPEDEMLSSSDWHYLGDGSEPAT